MYYGCSYSGNNGLLWINQNLRFLFAMLLLILQSSFSTSAFSSSNIIEKNSKQGNTTGYNDCFHDIGNELDLLILSECHIQQKCINSKIFKMQQNSFPPLQPPQECQWLFQKSCEQIDQQFQTLLSTLISTLPPPSSSSSSASMSVGNQSISKFVEKCMNSAKGIIGRILNARLPQIISIQNKYKRIIVEVSEELDMQKKKSKEIFGKYQLLVLEIDRYKMETVQIGQLYESLYKQYIQLKTSPQKLPTFRETEPKPQALTNQSYIRLQQELQQKNQQRQLYHKELSKNNEIILELRDNQRIANQRIANLIEENKAYEHIIQERELTIEMLKKQVAELVVEGEEFKIQIQAAAKNSQNRVLQLRQLHNKQVSFLKQTIQNLQKLYQKAKNSEQALTSENTLLQKCSTEYEKSLGERTQKLQQKQCQIEALHKKIEQLQKSVSQLETQTIKIKDISKNQQKLQNRYEKKIALLNKSNKDMNEKLAFYKSQNQRLYEAMEQYANKEVKLNGILKNYQNKIQAYKNKEIKVFQLKKKMLEFCSNAKKEIAFVKKNMGGQLEKNIRNILTGYKEQFVAFRIDYQQKISKKIQQLVSEKQKQKQALFQKLESLSYQNKILHQAKLQSQLNSNKIATSLVTSKNQLSCQLLKKDEIIHTLQAELIKQKQFNEASIKKISDVVKKYENTSLSELPININQNIEGIDNRGKINYELQKLIKMQSRRFGGLKCQFQSFLEK